MIVRKPTNGIYVGTVKIGDYAPVSIQSMITTDPVHTIIRHFWVYGWRTY